MISSAIWTRWTLEALGFTWIEPWNDFGLAVAGGSVFPVPPPVVPDPDPPDVDPPAVLVPPPVVPPFPDPPVEPPVSPPGTTSFLFATIAAYSTAALASMSSSVSSN